jgi:hypothetical protein
MRVRREMRNITITKEQERIVRENNAKPFGERLNCKVLAEQLGVSYGKLMANIFLMGINRKEIKEVDFDDGNGYFSIKKWAELYKI